MPKADPQELHWRDMEFLDHLCAIACLLRPYCDRNTREPFAAVVTTDARPWPNNADLTEDGWRFLEQVIGAIDGALEAREDVELREYPTEAMDLLVPARWTLHSLRRCWLFRDHPTAVDHQLPENVTEILACLANRARDVARAYRDESLAWWKEQSAEQPELAHV